MLAGQLKVGADSSTMVTVNWQSDSVPDPSMTFHVVGWTPTGANVPGKTPEMNWTVASSHGSEAVGVG